MDRCGLQDQLLFSYMEINNILTSEALLLAVCLNYLLVLEIYICKYLQFILLIRSAYNLINLILAFFNIYSPTLEKQHHKKIVAFHTHCVYKLQQPSMSAVWKHFTITKNYAVKFVWLKQRLILKNFTTTGFIYHLRT